jgi:hypothetical protein
MLDKKPCFKNRYKSIKQLNMSKSTFVECQALSFKRQHHQVVWFLLREADLTCVCVDGF